MIIPADFRGKYIMRQRKDNGGLRHFSHKQKASHATACRLERIPCTFIFVA
jgi:hypothetical protein